MATRFWDGSRDACADAGSETLPDACGQQDTPSLGRFRRGRSPGSRVSAFVWPSRCNARQWPFSTNARRSQLRGQRRHSPSGRTGFPLSSRPTLGGRTTTPASWPSAGALSMMI